MPPRDEISVSNGILNVQTGKLRPHTPEFLHANKFDIAWDDTGTATCPATDAFLNQVLGPEEQILFFEMVAHLLTPNTDIQKAVLLQGLGGNGKSIFLEIIKWILGFRNYSSETLRRLESNTFATANLLGKLANIQSDMTTERIPGSENLKKITTGETVPVERKYKTGSQATLYARMITSCNAFPRTEDDSAAFFRRWVVIKFERKFVEGDRSNGWRPPTEILTEIKKEGPGILLRAIKALAGLRERGTFTETTATRAALLEFQIATSSLSKWLDEHTVDGPEVYVRQDQVRKEYNEFCDAKGFERMDAESFSDKIRRFRPRVHVGKRGHENFATFEGIALQAGPF